MLWQICLTLLFIWYIIVVQKKRRKLKKLADQLPNKMKHSPILGHAVNLTGNSLDRTEVMKRVGQEALDHGGITSVWLAYKLLVVIADPEAADVVTKACLNKDEIMNVISNQLVGNGSIYAPVPVWRPRRKFLTQSFSQKSLKNFVRVFFKQSEILMDKLSNVACKGDFSFFEYVTKYTMDSVCESALGLEINSQSIPDHPMPTNFNQFCSLAAIRALKPWLYPDAIYKWTPDYPQYERTTTFLKKFVAQMIQLKKRSLSQQKSNIVDDEPEHDEYKTKSLLELLIETGGEKGFTDLELQEEIIVMVLAGTDTSAAGISFAAMMLARHPDIQEKLYQEITQVLEDDCIDIEPNSLSKLKYLDAVMKETLRLYPPVPSVVRKVEKDVTLPSGVTLVPGVCATLHIWAIHRNEKYWGPDANVFRPERFFEGPLNPCAFIAFSSGPRSCLGAQYSMLSMKTVLAHLVSRYRILPATDDNKADDELPVLFEIMTKHTGNFQVQLELRN